MGEYEKRASEPSCLVGSLLACFLFRPALAHNSGICIRTAALLNVIISIRLISLARSPARSLTDTQYHPTNISLALFIDSLAQCAPVGCIFLVLSMRHSGF